MGLFACGLLALWLFIGSYAGTWEDSAGNWARAYHGQTKPAVVTVHHSWYCRTPHFFYEAAYYFELSMPQSYLKNWVEAEKLTQVKGDLPLEISLPEKPVWFLPGRVASYDLWIAKSDLRPTFRLYQDRASHRVFVCDSSGM